MTGTQALFASTAVSFGRGGYNKSGDDDELRNYGRRGYNRSGQNGGRGYCYRGDDEEPDDGRGGYN